MKLKDKDLWNDTMSTSTRKQDKDVVAYAERWANLMEEWLEGGETLDGVALMSSHEANEEDIANGQQRKAVTLLTQCWVHGDALKKWDDSQRQ
jgi:hypothetical protein